MSQSLNPNIKLFATDEEIAPSDIAKKERAAKQAGIDIWNYSTDVLYAISNEEISKNTKAQRVLGIREVDSNEIWQQLLVWPRWGTITPWSSKVGDILRNVGVEWTGRVEKVIWNKYDSDSENASEKLADIWHDPMMQIVVPDFDQVEKMFEMWETGKMEYVNIQGGGRAALEEFNNEKWCGLSVEYIDYLMQKFNEYGRNPTDVEIFAFSQANSEHCYHGTFNGNHIIDWIKQDTTLFQRIKATHAAHPNRTKGAYKDNAAAFLGAEWVIPIVDANWKYSFTKVELDNTLKAETHNHPTGISPFPGAATWAGWEIRDDGAVGRWSIPNTGTSGYFVSNIDGNSDIELPEGRASAHDIITNGPLGAAAFNNEFGRPSLGGIFRQFDQNIGGHYFGYHKPIMLAGGKWNVQPSQIDRLPMPAGTLVIQIGGPNFNIGLWGGSASSTVAWGQSADLDFASVQRENPEMQRRCQEVISVCSKMEENNPTLGIHDVGAGGIWNAIQEFVHDTGKGAKLNLSNFKSADPSLSPMAKWSNESQERYIAMVSPDNIERFKAICERENVPYYIGWELTESTQFILENSDTNETLIDMDINDILWNPVPLELTDETVNIDGWDLNFDAMKLTDSIKSVISDPTVWNKSFLVTIWDRTVRWMTVQDQMVGPWQVPLANACVTTHGLESTIGEVITQWERTPLAVVNPAAASRMAIGESMTNLMSVYISDFQSIAGSWNWMADKKTRGQLSALHQWVEALEKLCISLGISIPVWKDSLSMKAAGPNGEVVAPVSLVTTFTAENSDISKILTPELQAVEDSELLLVDLGEGKNRMWGSILAQSHGQFWNETPDVDNPELLLGFMKAMRELHEKWLLLAYHDRSDGGLFATISEMSFASHLWVDIDLNSLMQNASREEKLRTLFNEELGAVMQCKKSDKKEILEILSKYGLASNAHNIGCVNLEQQRVSAQYRWAELFNEKRVDLQKAWSETSYKIQRGRDNPDTADQEFARIDDENELPMPNITAFDIDDHNAHEIIAHYEANNLPKPKVAVLRTQWINGQEEMARYFSRAWFDAYDITVSDIASGKQTLSGFGGIAVAGWFSYGDALGAGRWFAASILENEIVRKQCEEFKGFWLWVCNGCQTISQLWDILEGGENFPEFKQNTSTQFEARLSPVKISEPKDSIFLKWMNGSIVPVISSHGEWRVEGWNMISNLNYTDHNGNPTDQYPHNPNGSEAGATGFEHGKTFFMMGHPEREYDPKSPWLQVPLNLREWVENNK